MKNIVVWTLVVLLLTGCEKVQGVFPAPKDAPKFRFAQIVRSDIVRTVEATGTITPRNTSTGIPVGAQVNGKVIKLFVDYNSIVTNGQIVALIDPLVYEATYKNAIGQLHSNQASVRRCEAVLRLAEKTLVRKAALVAKKLCSDSDYDTALEARDVAEAQLAAARAAVEQSEASVNKAKADLDYCTIRSPVNGVVIARKVEEGETVVSSMNAVPVLTIAEDLKTIWVEATVPEADVGNVKVGQSVTFTADAYRRKFKGRVKQVRKFATTTNNVVTYPIIIEAENPDEMLFPGMTATLSIETARAENVIVVTAAAFRFRPQDADVVGVEIPKGRKLWSVTDGKLMPRVVKEGVSDTSFVEILDANDLEGSSVVVGYETARTAAEGDDKASNPFMPKFKRPNTKGTAPEPRPK